MDRSFLLALLAISTLWPPVTWTTSLELAKPGSESKCGDVDVPYPFGNFNSSFSSGSFSVNCTDRKSYLDATDVFELLLSGDLRIDGWMTYECYNSSGHTVTLDHKLMGPSHTSLCENETAVINGSCSGIGICRTSIPKGLINFDFDLQSSDGNWSFNPCSYAFLVDFDWFNSSAGLFLPRNFNSSERSLPMVLSSALGDGGACEKARNGHNDCSCGSFTSCSEAESGAGYHCSCLNGFRGDPYLPHGCQDIDECKEDNDRCISGVCNNLFGGFNCTCPPGTHGDYGTRGEGCVKYGSTSENFPVIEVALGASLGLFFLLLSCSWLYWAFRRRRHMKLKEKFFEANGGLLLQQRLSTGKGSSEAARIFTEEEIKRATDNYSESKIIGKGGSGIVYKGVLPNGSIVAIKKSRLNECDRQTEQFINEISILLQVNHRNVVKLLGCCLQVQVPLLVYEFVPNGTLFSHIHGQGQIASLSWNNRLRIAAEAAGALAYLHSSASTPIFHGDVKSANILLDKNYTAKVSDFGASKLVPSNYNQITTLVQGTFGYLDPEYFQTSKLTEKSDVYSFGVVLLELLTGKLPISFEASQEVSNLANRFISAFNEGRLVDILETRVAEEAAMEEIDVVSSLALSCLALNGAERPTMKKVASDLDGLVRRFADEAWVGISGEEAHHLSEDPPPAFNSGLSGIESLQRDVMLSLGR